MADDDVDETVEATTTPNDAADPQEIVDSKIPESVRNRYDVLSYKNAAVILAESHKEQFEELINVLNAFSITTAMIMKAGGNESEITKILSRYLRPLEWHETTISGYLVMRLDWKKQLGVKPSGKPRFKWEKREFKREKYLGGHKIDYVKGKVAFDLEWNSKDQTFDRDLYAFHAFFMAGAVDVGVLVTRSADLTPVFQELGVSSKYGASTTWWGKLVPRLNAGRNQGCPVLAIGIRSECISDLDAYRSTVTE